MKGGVFLLLVSWFSRWAQSLMLLVWARVCYIATTKLVVVVDVGTIIVVVEVRFTIILIMFGVT